nr:immunoglobulin light chain junction region [Macaca mulatta]MOV66121.1 immunoglobulin light chain junction region [Macaca mulatta]MOV66188.1 immunoglobulin light chain junction region [Macaca mulatta]MOV66225.1 immunoglobulin light chain junction region [Macaca mulatta]MOV66482.1 immunoglobulin light chain junction region [Macaca mulatta]
DYYCCSYRSGNTWLF